MRGGSAPPDTSKYTDTLKHFKSRSDKPSVVSEGLCECGIYEVLPITMSSRTDTEKMREREPGSVPAVPLTPQQPDNQSVI